MKFQIVEAKLPKTLILYHGTTLENAQNLLKNGWLPYSGTIGNNLGNNRYLYVTNTKENARWFSNEKGENIILQIKNIPFSSLKVDPEDGIKETVEEELEISPAYLVIINPISAENFSLVK